MESRPVPRVLALWVPALLLAACGGSGSNSEAPPPPPPPPTATFDPHYLVSGPSPFAANCEGAVQTGTAFANAEVEPQVAVNPTNTSNLVGMWQQDRWSNGSARGLVSAASFDGGRTWTRRPMPFSRCGGGNASNGGDYFRATDPWVSFGPSGTAYAMSLSTVGGAFQAGSANAMLAARSIDGGRTWSNPATLIRDGAGFFNDKNAITADPTDARYVYAVWDRLGADGGGPAYFARSSNGGVSWETARSIFDPGLSSQTIGNVIAVLPNGTLVNLFLQIDTAPGGATSAFVAIIRSSDQGQTWSAPIRIADHLAIGARDPENGTPIRDGAIIPQIAVSPGGTLFVVWQDARFSAGTRDGIALARSTDGGLTWSTPIRVNASTAVQAFTPTVHVRSDGMIGVTYFDLRSNTADANTLLTDYWLARSTDTATWLERRVAGPFDLDTAPNANGLFLGDYMGLTSVGNLFVPFFVQANSDNLGNRTDVIAAPQVSVATSVSAAGAVAESRLAPKDFVVTPELRQRVHENLVRNLEQRVPGWHGRVQRLREAESQP